MPRRKKQPPAKKPQRLRENRRPAYGVLVEVPHVDGRGVNKMVCAELYLHEEKARWVMMKIKEGNAHEVFGDGARMWANLPEGSEVSLLRFALVWDEWEDTDGSDGRNGQREGGQE